MTTTGGLAAGMAFLPQWLKDSREPRALDSLLARWSQASGWKSAGLVWPLEPTPRVMLLAKDIVAETLALPPAEARDVAGSLLDGQETVVWQASATATRLYTLIQPVSSVPGLLWAERLLNEPWQETDRSYLRLSARLIERSTAFGTRTGPNVDPERLQQRLADASVIAGRMAHDFDNILTGIIGFADLTQPMLPPEGKPSQFVGEISKVGQRGIVFTQQLHQLSRSGQTKPQPGSVAMALAKEEQRLKPQMPAGLKLTSQITTGMSAVAMEAGPLQTVLGHLLENAVEASAPGGSITVTAQPIELTAAEARAYLGTVAAGNHVEVTVQDTGSGIKPEVKAKLFVEPFFTTKVRHRGLGLAIVYRTLCAHRGGVRFDAATSPDSGTTVRVVLPLAAVRPVTVSSTTAGSIPLGV
ncbi:hypothetical protein BH11PLA2_BH11PLA2_07390 [soil metagenome]